jgi:hypothetical protein
MRFRCRVVRTAVLGRPIFAERRCHTGQNLSSDTFNPDSAAKTMRSASERTAAASAVSKNAKQMAASQRQKDFETEHSGVFATPGLLLAHCSTAESEFKSRPDSKLPSMGRGKTLGKIVCKRLSGSSKLVIA